MRVSNYLRWSSLLWVPWWAYLHSAKPWQPSWQSGQACLPCPSLGVAAEQPDPDTLHLLILPEVPACNSTVAVFDCWNDMVIVWLPAKRSAQACLPCPSLGAAAVQPGPDTLHLLTLLQVHARNSTVATVFDCFDCWDDSVLRDCLLDEPQSWCGRCATCSRHSESSDTARGPCNHSTVIDFWSDLVLCDCWLHDLGLGFRVCLPIFRVCLPSCPSLCAAAVQFEPATLGRFDRIRSPYNQQT